MSIHRHNIHNYLLIKNKHKGAGYGKIKINKYISKYIKSQEQRANQCPHKCSEQCASAMLRAPNAHRLWDKVMGGGPKHPPPRVFSLMTKVRTLTWHRVGKPWEHYATWKRPVRKVCPKAFADTVTEKALPLGSAEAHSGVRPSRAWEAGQYTRLLWLAHNVQTYFPLPLTAEK